MNVHNLLEEEVAKRTHALYKQALDTQAPWLSCACERCQTDTVCFVLNRLPPKYIVSSRGAAYTEASFDKQLVADIDALIIEGMQKINATKRPFHSEPKKTKNIFEGPAFNFPTLFGYVYHGNTFDPLQQGIITLFLDGEPAEMIDGSWVNPHIFNEKVKGSYMFLPAPIKSEKTGTTKAFSFELKITTDGYSPLTTVVTIPLISEDQVTISPNTAYSLKIQDIFLLPDEDES